MRPSCAVGFAQREKRARETPGARCTRSLACENKKARRVSHHRFTGITRRFPRNGFNGFLRALPSDRALLPLSFVARLTNLMPASGHQDHTTSPSAASIVRLIDTAASTASRPAFVTIAKRPSSPGQDAPSIHLIWVSEKAKYFLRGDWTGYECERCFARRANQTITTSSLRTQGPITTVVVVRASVRHRILNREITRCGSRLKAGTTS